MFEGPVIHLAVVTHCGICHVGIYCVHLASWDATGALWRKSSVGRKSVVGNRVGGVQVKAGELPIVEDFLHLHTKCHLSFQDFSSSPGSISLISIQDHW